MRRAAEEAETGSEPGAMPRILPTFRTDAEPRSGPLGVLGPTLGRILEPLYRGSIRQRNRRFDRGRGVAGLGVPVISVGNLSVGGTGKTPVVMLIVRELIAMGRRPCIAMRGYSKGRTISPGVKASASVHFSDEADEYSRALPGIPVVAQPNRLAGLIALLGSDRGREIDCVVLDDGFQHRRIARDLDIVLVDASRDPFEDRLLPAGWLREPVGSLRRAQLVLVTHAELVPPEKVSHVSESVRKVHPGATVVVARHEWAGLKVSDSGGEHHETTSWLRGKRVVAACAIGNPRGFLGSLARTGAVVVDQLILPDHDPYREPTMTRLMRLIQDSPGHDDRGREDGSRVDALVTTEKDWSKLNSPNRRFPCPVVRGDLLIEFSTGRDELSGALCNAVSRPEHRTSGALGCRNARTG